MKRLILCCAAWLCVFAGAKAELFDHSYTNFGKVLERHVANGAVEYHALKKDRRALDDFLRAVGSVNERDYQGWSRQQRLAFLLNTYNAAVLQLVIDRYPVSSIKRIGGWFANPFRMKFVPLFGTRISLDDIEHGMVRPEFHEPRIHFALVCAARSCPPLRREPYLPAKLDRQLDDQTRLFLNDPSKNRIELDSRIARLSAIFKWFRDDFGANDDALLKFVAPYWPETIRRKIENGGFTVRYLDYDWQLNDRKH